MHITNILRALILTISLINLSGPHFVSAAMDYNERIEFQDDFDSCSGERVLIHGIQHITGRVVTDGTGRTRFIFTRNTQGTGIGYDSGAEYTLIDTVYQSSIEFTSGEEQFLMQEYQTRFIRRGEAVPGDDTLVHLLTRITLNANGDLVTSVEIQDVTCQ